MRSYLQSNSQHGKQGLIVEVNTQHFIHVSSFKTPENTWSAGDGSSRSRVEREGYSDDRWGVENEGVSAEVQVPACPDDLPSHWLRAQRVGFLGSQKTQGLSSAQFCAIYNT